jgi:hypothetical protein
LCNYQLPAALVAGEETLKALTTEYAAKGAYFEAAKTQFALSKQGLVKEACQLNLVKEALAMLKQSDLLTKEAKQFEWAVLSSHQWLTTLYGSDEEKARIQALVDEAETNSDLRKDPYVTVINLAVTAMFVMGLFPFAWNEGKKVSNESIHGGISYCQGTTLPLLKQASKMVSKRQIPDSFFS